MKLAATLAGLALLLSLGISGGAVAQDQDPNGQLRLTPQQRTALEGIRERFETRRQDLLVRLKSKRLELVNLLKRDDVDKTSVQAKLDEILQLEADRQRLFVEELFAAKGELRPAQWGMYRRKVLRHLLNR